MGTTHGGHLPHGVILDEVARAVIAADDRVSVDAAGGPGLVGGQAFAVENVVEHGVPVVVLDQAEFILVGPDVFLGAAAHVAPHEFGVGGLVHDGVDGRCTGKIFGPDGIEAGAGAQDRAKGHAGKQGRASHGMLLVEGKRFLSGIPFPLTWQYRWGTADCYGAAPGRGRAMFPWRMAASSAGQIVSSPWW